MALDGASTSSGGRGTSSGGRGRGKGRDRGRSDGGDRGRGGAMGRGDGDDAMDIENGGRVDDREEDIAIIVERLQRIASQGDFHRRPINGVKLGTVHFVDGCIKKAHYKKTLLAIVRSLWDKDTINTSGKMREAFLDSCAIDYRVYYNYECTDEEGDRYVKAHIQNNWKQLLSKEKSRADERVKLAISLGYTHATRLMVKPHYFNEGAWESIINHWETEKFKKASDIGRQNRAKLDFNNKSGAVPFCVRRWALDANLETPITDLEFFKYVYNIDEPTIKKIMESLEAMMSTQPAPEVPLSPASQRKRDLALLIKAIMPKKTRLVLYPRNSISELVGADETAKLNMSQEASQTSILDDAYSLIRRVLSEVSTTVKSLEGIERVARAEVNEMIEKLATVAFPDKTDPVQQASWEQYVRIGTEIIDQVMQNFEKVIVEAGMPERVPGEHTRLLLEMDDERDLNPDLFYCPLYE
ncbi:uncharacterized protein LOC141712081 isoform X1 [Apium graveolens]|uniref:uncharacterized protein LOC141712081 isoform X1 n=2 Tax=Apium graveolens TaxID=4045 RepID=UPI003D79CD36